MGRESAREERRGGKEEADGGVSSVLLPNTLKSLHIL